MVDCVSELTRDPWEKVFDYGIIEFLNLYSYYHDRLIWMTKDVNNYKRIY